MRENLLTLNRDERMGIIHALDECTADMAGFDLNRRAAELQMSETLNSIAKSAVSMPLDLGNPEDLKAGLSTSLVDFCEAMDRDEFSFHTRKAAASVVGLACIAFCLVHGRPGFEQATAH